MKSFWESCEARAPLTLEVEVEGASRAIRHVFDRPFLVIGSGPRSDLLLNHPEVSRRHVYLQVIAGRLFFVDLESRIGTHLGEEKSGEGWLNPDRPIRIGPYTIRAKIGETASGAALGVAPSPLSSRGKGPGPWPLTTLDLEHQGGSKSLGISRTMTLIGRSKRCKIRLTTPKTSRFHASLLRTLDGLWVIDLRSTARISVNGACMDYARLEAGDELRVGPLVAKVGESSEPTTSKRARVPAELPGKARSSAIVRSIDPSTMDLQAILEQVSDIQHHSNDQVRQAILMLTQLFGSMHRETMDLVREELEQIRNLAGELKAIREESSSTNKPPPGLRPDLVEDGSKKPRDPGEIHLIVSERLATFERERRGRWNTLSRILSKTEL